MLISPSWLVYLVVAEATHVRFMRRAGFFLPLVVGVVWAGWCGVLWSLWVVEAVLPWATLVPCRNIHDKLHKYQRNSLVSFKRKVQAHEIRVSNKSAPTFVFST